jgi:hypothetical protein
LPIHEEGSGTATTCCGGGNLNLEENRREKETWIKVRVSSGLWGLFGRTNLKILKISSDRAKISDPAINRIFQKFWKYLKPW